MATKTANFTTVSQAFTLAAQYAAKVDELRRDAKRDKVSLLAKEIKVWLAPATAAHYGVQLVPKERGEGETWGKDTKSQTAKKQNDRLAASIVGASKGDREEVEVPAELLEAARKLAKLAQKYEGARALASKAVAAAFAE